MCLRHMRLNFGGLKMSNSTNSRDVLHSAFLTFYISLIDACACTIGEPAPCSRTQWFQLDRDLRRHWDGTVWRHADRSGMNLGHYGLMTGHIVQCKPSYDKNTNKFSLILLPQTSRTRILSSWKSVIGVCRGPNALLLRPRIFERMNKD